MRVLRQLRKSRSLNKVERLMRLGSAHRQSKLDRKRKRKCIAAFLPLLSVFNVKQFRYGIDFFLFYFKSSKGDKPALVIRDPQANNCWFRRSESDCRLIGNRIRHLKTMKQALQPVHQKRPTQVCGIRTRTLKYRICGNQNLKSSECRLPNLRKVF